VPTRTGWPASGASSPATRRTRRTPNRPEDEEAALVGPDGQANLLFIRVPEPKTVKNRVHLDLMPTGRTRDEEVQRLLGLGATLLADRRRPDGSGWLVLADPEGNELCVERSAAERAAQT
jgi:Glyoxalase-like domain